MMERDKRWRLRGRKDIGKLITGTKNVFLHLSTMQ
jgi:hypothetical protein